MFGIPLTQAGGGNTDLYGVYKTSEGVVCVGRQTADTNGVPFGNNLPVINVTPWGNTSPQNESAVLVYYKALNLYNPNDSTIISGTSESNFNLKNNEITIYPNPTSDKIFISFNKNILDHTKCKYKLTNLFGQTIREGTLQDTFIDFTTASVGMYQLLLFDELNFFTKKVHILR
ncbi:MAG: T9SS type A sorting domain-containing protein [Bacteroidetes bacterium]|nr:T9SS type A sorting domain-containing protein [Bacteroidota bacterium]